MGLGVEAEVQEGAAGLFFFDHATNLLGGSWDVSEVQGEILATCGEEGGLAERSEVREACLEVGGAECAGDRRLR